MDIISLILCPGLYWAILPYTFLKNTSENRARIVDIGWKNVIKNVFTRNLPPIDEDAISLNNRNGLVLESRSSSDNEPALNIQRNDLDARNSNSLASECTQNHENNNSATTHIEQFSPMSDDSSINDIFIVSKVRNQVLINEETTM